MSGVVVPVIGLLALLGGIGIGLLAARRGFERWCRTNEFAPTDEDWDLPGLTASNAREAGLGVGSYVHELDMIHTGHRRGLPILAARELIGQGEDRSHAYIAAMRCATRDPFAYAGDDFLGKGAIPQPGRATLRALVNGKRASHVFSDGRAIVVRTRHLATLSACLDGLASAVDAIERHQRDEPRWPTDPGAGRTRGAGP